MEKLIYFCAGWTAASVAIGVAQGIAYAIIVRST